MTEGQIYITQAVIDLAQKRLADASTRSYMALALAAMSLICSAFIAARVFSR